MERYFKCIKEFSLLQTEKAYGSLYNVWKVGDILSDKTFVSFNEITPKQLEKHFIEVELNDLKENVLSVNIEYFGNATFNIEKGEKNEK